ncbi:hypothetical protein HDU87_000903 [Geranomyces variabilis]|uniref:Uncharacterized protein n=1 Tax=Geranomyces variabilis TaxID=109894 RepID=A0AAD5TE45_9FUNG|nr:hypothetical protein HDU87_000903 [Geranomyces variabilis]
MSQLRRPSSIDTPLTDRILICRACGTDLPDSEKTFKRHLQKHCKAWLKLCRKPPQIDNVNIDKFFDPSSFRFYCQACPPNYSGRGRFDGCFKEIYDQSRHEWRKHKIYKDGMPGPDSPPSRASVVSRASAGGQENWEASKFYPPSAYPGLIRAGLVIPALNNYSGDGDSETMPSAPSSPPPPSPPPQQSHDEEEAVRPLGKRARNRPAEKSATNAASHKKGAGKKSAKAKASAREAPEAPARKSAASTARKAAVTTATIASLADPPAPATPAPQNHPYHHIPAELEYDLESPAWDPNWRPFDPDEERRRYQADMEQAHNGESADDSLPDWLSDSSGDEGRDETRGLLWTPRLWVPTKIHIAPCPPRPLPPDPAEEFYDAYGFEAPPRTLQRPPVVGKSAGASTSLAASTGPVSPTSAQDAVPTKRSRTKRQRDVDMSAAAQPPPSKRRRRTPESYSP